MHAEVPALNGKRITRKTFGTRGVEQVGRARARKLAVYLPGYNLSRGEFEANFSTRAGEKGKKRLEFMPRTWQLEKPRSNDRNATTMHHVSSSSSSSSFPE